MFQALRKLWALLPSKQRRQFVLIVGMMALAAAMEMVGIGALLPIIGVMQSPGLIVSNKALASLSVWMGSPSSQSFFVVLLAGLLCFFLLKNLFLVYLDLANYRYLTGVQARLSKDLLRSYLRQPYAFHLQTNTAHLIRNVTTEITSLFNYTLVPIGTLMSECLVVSALFVLVLLVDARIAFALSFIGGVVVLAFYRFFRRRMYQIGKNLQASSGSIIQQAQEGLGGIKEIQVMGREAFFERAFSRGVDANARALRRALVIHNFPIHFLETLFVAIFVGMLVYSSYQSRSAELIPLMGVYAAATFRLIPSLNRIMTAFNRLKHGSSSLKLVVGELESSQTPPLVTTPMPSLADRIDVENVHYRYPEAETEALKGISLQIARGEMVGFVGRSGSGKTSLVDCILGLLTPTQGSIRADGVDIQDDLRGWRRQIGYIPQDIYLTDDSLRRNIALGLDDEQIDDARVWAALEAAQMADFVRELPASLETSIGERGVRLSGGQRQRIGIARAMYCAPAVLVLDEATSALDHETERAIVRTVSGLKGSRTIIVIAHRLTTIEDCDRVLMLDQGLLVEPTATRAGHAPTPGRA
jgi:ATP-binding cassette subfamily C protein